MPAPIVLENAVTFFHDAAWISAHTALYINSLYSLEESQIVAITDEIYRRTGFDVHVHTLALDQLLGHKVPFSKRDRLGFMAGRPIWRLPAMFVRGAAGMSRNSPAGKALNQAMAMQAVFGKTVVKKAFEIEYSRSKNRWPHGMWHARANEHAKEFFTNALGVRRVIDSDGDLVDQTTNVVDRVVAGVATREIVAIKRYKYSAAQTIARKAIERPRKKDAAGAEHTDERQHIYNSNIERIVLEVAHSRNVFGFELDAVAMGAWYHRIVTALRLGASVFEHLDDKRQEVAALMLRANTELQELRRLGAPTPVDQARMDTLHAEIAEHARLFQAETGAALEEIDPLGRVAPHREDVVFRCIIPFDAAIMAFFGGVNARMTIPGICPDVPQSFDDILVSLVWLGHLHRHRVRDLTSEIAHPLLSALNVWASEAPPDPPMRRCMEIGMSVLNSHEDKALLFEAVAEVASTGDPRTVCLMLQDVAADPAEVNGRQQDGSGAQDVRHPVDNQQAPPPEDNSQQYLRFNPELRIYQTSFSELRLGATFVSLPPFYQEEWAGRCRVLRDEHGEFVAAVSAPVV
jgi:hypothetical protein